MPVLPCLLASLAALAAPPAATPPEPPAAAEGAPAEGEPEAAAVPDRSGPPPVSASEILALPEPELHELGPGLTAMYVRAPGVRKTSIHAVLRRGMVELDGGPAQAGRATGYLADVAAGDLDGPELSERADLHEVSVYSRIGLHDGEVSLDVPREELPTGAELQRLILREPSFPKRDLKRWIIDQRLFYLTNGPKSPAAVASSALSFAWFPADHPYGARPDLSQLDALKAKALRDRWQTWIRGTPITVLVVGDLDWSEAEPSVRALVEGLGAPGEPGAEIPFEAPGATRVLAVHMPGQRQVTVRMRTAAPALGADDAPAMVALDDILGGQFLSRLNRVLREEKGFTYGARSRYQKGRTWGSLTVEVDVDAENLGETIDVIEREVGRMVDEPVTSDELESARRSLAAEWNRTFETAGRAMATYSGLLSVGLTITEARERLLATDAATPDDLQRVAARWLAESEPRVWVLVGDREAMAPALDAQGWEVEWLDPTAAILGKF